MASSEAMIPQPETQKAMLQRTLAPVPTAGHVPHKRPILIALNPRGCKKLVLVNVRAAKAEASCAVKSADMTVRPNPKHQGKTAASDCKSPTLCSAKAKRLCRNRS